MKYYLISYGAAAYAGERDLRDTRVIDEFPLAFIKKNETVEEEIFRKHGVGGANGSYYHNFYLTCSMEITKEEYDAYNN